MQIKQMKKRLEMKIFGKVQGVFFRASARQVARKMKINGYARNHEDGTVGIVAQGEEADLREFLNWCQKGPDLAVVERVDFEFKNELEGLHEFVVM